MSNIYQEIRERVSLEDFARDNGFAPNRSGKCSCPFHTDNTPSLKIYSSEQRWKCFSCQGYGDITDLASMLWNCSKLEAVKRLDEQYHLGLDLRGNRAKYPISKSRTITFDLKAWQRDADVTIAWIIDVLWWTAEAGKRVGVDEELISSLQDEIASLEELHDEMLKESPAEEFKKYHDTVRRLRDGAEQHREAFEKWLGDEPF